MLRGNWTAILPRSLDVDAARRSHAFSPVASSESGSCAVDGMAWVRVDSLTRRPAGCPRRRSWGAAPPRHLAVVAYLLPVYSVRGSILSGAVVEVANACLFASGRR
jgi:hypothetical protein